MLYLKLPRRIDGVRDALLRWAEDPRALGLALDFADDQDVGDLATSVFVRLAPLAPPEEMRLRARHQRRLVALLRRQDEVVVLAALEVIGRLGDASSTKDLARLASGSGLARESLAVRDRARVCLDDLTRRLAAEGARATLLRPSALPALAERLLRPVGPAEGPETRSLPRPASAPGDALMSDNEDPEPREPGPGPP